MAHAPLIIAALAACTLNINLQGQITEVGAVPERLLSVRSLHSAGVKVYSQTQTSVTLYNLDLSVYTTINYPPPPLDQVYFDILYFTESTFDTDPSTIELMLLTTDTLPMYTQNGTRVISQDGTILFEDLTHTFSGYGGYHELNSRPPLFMGEDGVTYMLLSNYPWGAPTESKLYQLPGSLPCIDCDGTHGLALGTEELGEGAHAIILFPNPTTDRVSVEYAMPAGSGPARLMVTDAEGRLVDLVPIDNSGRGSFSMAGQANGTYTCSVIMDGSIVGSKALVLVR